MDTGCVVAYQPTIDFDIEFIRGIRNWMFGGEGLFFAVMRGPGKVWIQSLPISRLASRIIQYSPQIGPQKRRRKHFGRAWKFAGRRQVNIREFKNRIPNG